jgi:hypothetical protein
MAIRKLRSNHQRLVKLKVDRKDEVDNPLQLKSTDAWDLRGACIILGVYWTDVHVLEILQEIVQLGLSAPVKNPFAIQHAFFDDVPLAQSVTLTAALIMFLNKVYSYAPTYAPEGSFL